MGDENLSERLADISERHNEWVSVCRSRRDGDIPPDVYVKKRFSYLRTAERAIPWLLQLATRVGELESSFDADIAGFVVAELNEQVDKAVARAEAAEARVKSLEDIEAEAFEWKARCERITEAGKALVLAAKKNPTGPTPDEYFDALGLLEELCLGDTDTTAGEPEGSSGD